MGVPSSGTLSMLKMAREAKHGDYNGTQVMGTISLYDMVNGGNANGSTVSYPTVNDNCTPNPITRNSHKLANLSKWVSGNTWTAQNNNLYFNSNIGDATDLDVGDYLFTNTSLTTSAGAGSWRQSNQVANNDEYHCYVSNSCADTYITTNSSGQITFIACDFCP
jgi:hypothetical protein